MRKSDRLRPRPAFLDASRRVRIYFETGSIAKFEHAELVFRRLGLPILRSRSDHADGIEDYYGGVQQLIEQKLRDVSLGRQNVYFVEDTYVRINALSDPTNATPLGAEWAASTVPGLKTKEWFESLTFQELNSQLSSKGGDRSASVYSTVGLHVPGISNLQIFSGSTAGCIAARPGEGLRANEEFLWLDPNSFNGWFIPEGEDVPLSDLHLEHSLDVDFRVTALLGLADKLEEYMAVLNLPSVSVELIPHRQRVAQQPQLFPTRRPPIAVIGLTCAGKTTLGQFLSEYGYEHIEASSVLRNLQGNDLAPNSRVGYFQAITTLSERGWDTIARRAVRLYEPFIESGICITGLRTVEELNFLARMFPDLVVVLLEAPSQIRYERYMYRDRVGDEASLTRFREREREHANFGLVSVSDHCATVRMFNHSTLRDLEALARELAQTGSAISGHYVTRQGVGVEAARRSQLYRCALALAGAERPLSPADIEMRQRKDDKIQVVKRNAVRKALAAHPVLVRRVGEREGTTFYELTEHGHTYLSLIEALGSHRSYSELELGDLSETDAFSHIHSK